MGETKRLAVDADIRDDHDLWRQIGNTIQRALRRHTRHARLTKLSSEIDKLLWGQVLIADNNHLMFVPGLKDGLCVFTGPFSAEVEPDNLCAERRIELRHIKNRSFPHFFFLQSARIILSIALCNMLAGSPK